MNIEKIKKALAKKLRDENSSFTKKDISIEKVSKNEIWIKMRDYENVPISVKQDKDDYFGYVLFIRDEFDEGLIGMCDSKVDYPWDEAMIEVGYYIASRF